MGFLVSSDLKNESSLAENAISAVRQICLPSYSSGPQQQFDNHKSCENIFKNLFSQRHIACLDFGYAINTINDIELFAEISKTLCTVYCTCGNS